MSEMSETLRLRPICTKFNWNPLRGFGETSVKLDETCVLSVGITNPTAALLKTLHSERVGSKRKPCTKFFVICWALLEKLWWTSVNCMSQWVVIQISVLKIMRKLGTGRQSSNVWRGHGYIHTQFKCNTFICR